MSGAALRARRRFFMLARARRKIVGRKILVLATCLAAAAPVVATARQNPPPPPSGIVIHLFGQDSIMSTVLPTTPQAVGPNRPTVSTGGAPTPAYVEPTTGEILHQMFVTGDPNDPQKPSTGRSKDPLAH
jgi:hypothetical protein